jgi:hypothetical protein
MDNVTQSDRGGPAADSTRLVSNPAAPREVHASQHHRHLDELAPNGGQGGTGLELEQPDCRAHGEFEEF